MNRRQFFKTVAATLAAGTAVVVVPAVVAKTAKVVPFKPNQAQAVIFDEFAGKPFTYKGTPFFYKDHLVLGGPSEDLLIFTEHDVLLLQGDSNNGATLTKLRSYENQSPKTS